jgi:hypothetical protein
MKRSGIISNLAASVALAAVASPATTIEWQRLGGTHAATTEARSVAGGAFATPNPESGAGVASGFLTHPYLVNSDPFLVGALPDLRLTRGASHPGIQLDTVLVDLDGDTLVQSVRSGLLGASIEDGVLRLETMVVGKHSVVVQASDGRFTTADTFQVEILASTSIERRRPSLGASAPTSLRIPRFLAVRSQVDGTGSLESACDDDGCLTMDILLPGPGRIEVHILDNLGTPVMDFQRRIDAPSFAKLSRDESNRAVVPLSWNLRSGEGRAVATGVYLWRIRVVTDAGEEFETIRRLGVREPR